MSYKRLFSGLMVLLASIFIAGACLQPETQSDEKTPKNGENTTASDWRDIALTDIATGEEFKISDFAGKPVLVESFAVWCVTCLEQQRQIKILKASEGDSVIHVSLDTDPNEDAEAVRAHFESNGFDWYFAVAPIELTNDLISEFSLTIVSAPMAPVLLVCEDQTARLLDNGVKSADRLLSEIERGCSG